MAPLSAWRTDMRGGKKRSGRKQLFDLSTHAQELNGLAKLRSRTRGVTLRAKGKKFLAFSIYQWFPNGGISRLLKKYGALVKEIINPCRILKQSFLRNEPIKAPRRLERNWWPTACPTMLCGINGLWRERLLGRSQEGWYAGVVPETWASSQSALSAGIASPLIESRAKA